MQWLFILLTGDALRASPIHAVYHYNGNLQWPSFFPLQPSPHASLYCQGHGVGGSKCNIFSRNTTCNTCHCSTWSKHLMATTKSWRPCKGKNFTTPEEKHLCWSVLHVSQDPITGNGQQSFKKLDLTLFKTNSLVNKMAYNNCSKLCSC
jgi:hypothetical protein